VQREWVKKRGATPSRFVPDAPEKNEEVNMDKSDEFEGMALKLAALNLFFESAKPGSPGREFLKMSEEMEVMIPIGLKTESPESV
jgi:hypothetical protein